VVEAAADRVPARFRVGVDRRVVAAVAVLALVAVALALVGWWRARPQSVDAPPTTVAGSGSAVAATGHSVGDPPTPSPVGSAGPVTVHVAGKVARPGVVVLPPGSRVADALQAAGGPLPAADLTTLNLARPLADGEQVPVGVPGAPAAVPGTVPAGPSAAAGPLDLNTATVEQLEQLPGVGPVLARQILEKRTQLGGRFTSVDQLRQIRGIGERKFADIKPKVRV
jgi:competence protein ComEA